MKILYEDEEKFHPDEIVSMPGFKVTFDLLNLIPVMFVFIFYNEVVKKYGKIIKNL